MGEWPKMELGTILRLRTCVATFGRSLNSKQSLGTRGG
jgi:hypothetical protein